MFLVKHVVNFDRRNTLADEQCFPLVDTNGDAIKNERRLDASIYLDKIEIKEEQLHEDEFTKLFKQ